MVLAKKDHLLKTEPDEGTISLIHFGMKLSQFNSCVVFLRKAIHCYMEVLVQDPNIQLFK